MPALSRPSIAVGGERCWRCGTTVSGQLSIPLVARLPEEQARFVDAFLLGSGSLTQTQKALSCSYPKVRRLLDDSIATLRAEIEAAHREKEEILDALEGGSITGSQAVQLVQSLLGLPQPLPASDSSE
ncbi:MAG: DUF2089 family protein [Planctomycetes bacterium]|nr:DUF2089 family protein [Planctomycetota bacterium]